ncbi:MAG: PIG-L deacetylase family protein [Aquihabitans sp.]
MIGDPAGPIVVLSPHLDDAVISAWSVLQSAPPTEVQVVEVFAGIPQEGATGPYDPIFGATDSAALVRQRRAEDIEALRAVSLTPVHLPHLDDQYRSKPVDPGELAWSIDDAVPTASVLVAPAGIGRHPDHVAVRDLALEVASQGGIELQLYADLPYATSLGWPSWVTGDEPDPHLVPDAAWARVLADVGPPDELEPIVTCFDEAEREAKLDACRCYRSQWPALEGGPNRRISNPAISSFEVRWRVTRPG